MQQWILNQEKKRSKSTAILPNPPRNIAGDQEYYRRKPAPACMKPEFLTSEDKKLVAAARVVWPQRYGSQLPEKMTFDEYRRALNVRRGLIYWSKREV